MNDFDYSLAYEVTVGLAARAQLESKDILEFMGTFSRIRERGKSGASMSELMIHLNAINVIATVAAKRLDKQDRDQKESKMVNMTINFGSGNTFTGPVAIGQSIQQTVTLASSAANDDLRNELESLTQLTSKLIEAIPSIDDKEIVAATLKQLVQAATKQTASPGAVKITGAGLIEAAKAVAELSAPIATSVLAILKLLSLS